jgi:hypothetical protein
MASRIGLKRAVDGTELAARRGHVSSPHGQGAGAVAANDHLDTADIIAVRAAALLEQLLAIRLELSNGIAPRAERGVLTKQDLDYMRVQLDAAAASTRGLVATCGAAPVAIVRQRDFWRSEELPATKA